ncbi:MAG: histidine kinase [Salibacteraceae bacterium]
MNWRILLIVVGTWLMLMTNTIWAQSLPEVETVWSGGIVHTIAEDGAGFLWLSTNRGLFRYDGYTFHPYELPDTLLLGLNEKQNGVFADTGGWMWLSAREAGLVHFHPATGQWRHFLHNPDDPSSPADNRINMQWQDAEGRWWFGMHTQSLDRFDPQNQAFVHTRFHKDEFSVQENSRLNIINQMLPDPASPDHFWVATGLGVVYFNHKTGHHKVFPVRDNPDLELENSIQTIYLRADDYRIWCGTWGGGIMALDTANRSWEQWMYRELPEIHGGYNAVFSMKHFSEEAAWICTIDSGLGLFYFEEQRFQFLEKQVLHKASGSPSNSHLLLEGPGNGLWVMTNDGLGKVAAQNQKFSWQSVPNRLNRGSRYFTISGGYLKNDSLWLTSVTGDGVYLREPRGKMRSFSFQEGGKKQPFNSGKLYEIDGGLWAIWGVGPTIFRVNPEVGAVEKIPHQLPAMTVNTTLFDGKRSLYLGTRWKGLVKLDVQTLQITYRSDAGAIPVDSNAHIAYFALQRDGHGNYWAGTDRGILVFDSTMTFQYSFPLRIDEVDNVRYRHVSGLHRDVNGRMWISSWDGGFGYIHEDSLGKVQLHERMELTGWPKKAIKNFLIDEDRWMWILQEEGLSAVPPEHDTVYVFTQEDGLPLDRSPYSLFSLGNGRVGVGCSYGYVEGNKANLLQPDTSHTRVGINQLRIMGKACFNGRAFAQQFPLQLELPYNENFLSCDLVPLHFSGGRNVISWRLDGVDQQWNDTVGPVSLNYAALAPGQYTLLVKANTRNGVEPAPETILTLTIHQPFWATWWFRMVIVLMVLSAFGAIYWIRIRQVKQRQRLRSVFERQLTEMEIRALRAQLNPHFIFNSLNALKHFLISGNAHQGVRFLNKFAGLLRMILNQSQHTETTLESELEFVELYLNLEQMRFDGSFDWNLDLEAGLFPEQLLVPPLLIQPFAENAVWHGLMHKEDHRKLQLRVYEQKGFLHIEVEDNGIGRSKAMEFKSRQSHRQASYGTEISRQRLHHLIPEGADYEPLQIHDLKTEEGRALGTRVLLVLPIQRLQHANRRTG